VVHIVTTVLYRSKSRQRAVRKCNKNLFSWRLSIPNCHHVNNKSISKHIIICADILLQLHFKLRATGGNKECLRNISGDASWKFTYSKSHDKVGQGVTTDLFEKGFGRICWVYCVEWSMRKEVGFSCSFQNPLVCATYRVFNKLSSVKLVTLDGLTLHTRGADKSLAL
jgi:hypothetical protein